MASIRQEIIKVIDFSIAKLVSPGRELRPTEPGAIVGTVLYMAPEQLESGEATPRSDVYSLGLVLVEMLTGRVPVDGGVAGPAGQGQAVVQGGRYDEIGQVFGRARPATGFSTDLATLLLLGSTPGAVSGGIHAPAVPDIDLDRRVAELRGLYPALFANEAKARLTPGDLLRLALRVPLGFVVYLLVHIAVRLRPPAAGWTRGR